MNPFSSIGSFWDPKEPDRAVTGRLTFNGVTIELDLFGTFSPTKWSDLPNGDIAPHRVTHPHLFGRLIDGPHSSRGALGLSNHITLLNATGTVIPIPASEVNEHWEAERILIGAHSTSDTTTEAQLTFDGLQAWANTPRILETIYFDGTFTADTRELDLHSASIGGAFVRLRAGMEGSWGMNVHLDRRTYAQIELPEPIKFTAIYSLWARPIHDLLIVCIGSSVALNEVRVEVSTIEEATASAALVFAANQDTTDHDYSASRMRETGTAALLFPEDTPTDFAQFLPEWMELHTELRTVVDQLTSVFYAPFMYSENRYSNIFKAAEDLAKRCFETSDLPKHEHTARVASIVDSARQSAVPEEHVKWAESVLRARNDSPLRKLIDQLIDDSGTVGLAIRKHVPKVAQRIVRSRTAASHGGLGLDVEEQFWLGSILTYLLRMHLLRELGMKPDLIERRVLSARPFGRALMALAD